MKTHQEAGRRNSAQVGTFLRCRVAAADLAGVRRRGVYLAAAVGEDLAPISGLLVGSPGAPGQTGLLMRGEINDKSLVRTQLNAEFTPLFRPHRPCSRPPSASSFRCCCCCWHCRSQRLCFTGTISAAKHINGLKEYYFIYSQKTRHANFRGNPLYQAMKQHLNNS